MKTLLQLSFMPWIIVFPIIALLFLIAPILIGVIVYRDALKRNVLSPLVWAIVAALVPFYIGLLLYVIIGVTQTQDRSQP
jgi:putative effector of murein hydrolase LrgA (UPF0299 family)